MILKDWWEGLAEREQKIVAVGGFFGGLLLFYALIWSPLTSAVDMHRNATKQQASLLSFLNRASVTINHLRASGVQLSTEGSQDLTTQAEDVFSVKNISAFIKQVQQPKMNAVTFSFASVPFDQLMQALQTLGKSGVKVTKFSAVKQSESGLADVKLTLLREE